MRLIDTGRAILFIGAALVGSTAQADARAHRASSGARVNVIYGSGGGHADRHAHLGGRGRHETYQATSFASIGSSYSGSGSLQCVPFARENSGIELAGNASAWWSAAQGVYERGERPEVGSVLNFRANGRMRMGHVAVVSNVVNPRMVQVDHANWSGPGGGRGAVSRNVTVIDVSPTNDWSAVRVSLGRGAEFGSVYPTYGFIYDRPDHGVLVANTATAPMQVAENAPPRDLRPAAERSPVDSPTGLMLPRFDLPRFSLVTSAQAAAIPMLHMDDPVEVAEAPARGSRHHSRHMVVASRGESHRALAGRPHVSTARAAATTLPATAAHHRRRT